MTAKPGIMERLKHDIVLCAEGYIFELERRGYVKAGPYVPEIVLENPEAVKELHREFVNAGSEVVLAFTYYGHREKMRAIGKEGLLEDLNRFALRIAKEVADEGDALVAGNLSNTWRYDPDDKIASYKTVRAMFEEQTRWAVEEGVDFIIAETFPYLGEAKIALEVIKEAGLPALVTFIPSCEQSFDGFSWAEACKILEDEGADIVGLNCGRGPETMYAFLEEIRANTKGYLAAQPVPYRTTSEHPSFMDLRLENGDQAFPCLLDPFLLTRDEMGDFAKKAREIGINFIGICCGAGPHHVRSMAEALGRTVPASKFSADLSAHPVLGKTGIFCADDTSD